MKWIVKIEGKKDQRIVVKFEPKSDELVFIGQYRAIPNNLQWVEFSEERCSINVDLEMIQNKLLSTYETMKTRIEAYNNIAEGFTVIKTIEIQEISE